MSDGKTLTRQELYERVWKEPMTKVAAEFGLSDRGLAKICERNTIPVPPRGYWARKGAGQMVKKPPLLAVAGEGNRTIAISRHWADLRKSEETPGTNQQNPFAVLMERELQDAMPLPVPGTLHSPHRIVEQWLKDAEEDAKRLRTYGSGSSRAHRYAAPFERRRLRVLSALFRALEGRGFVLEPDQYRPNDISARFGRDTVTFILEERIRQQRRRLTDDERKKRAGSATQEWTQTRENTGELIFKIKCSKPSCLPEAWKDKLEKPLELQLSEILIGFVVTAAYLQQVREERAAEERRRWEAAEEARKQAELLQAEEERTTTVCLHARSWARAEELRRYVSAVGDAVRSGKLQASDQELEDWIRRADAHAHELDPITSARALSVTRVDLDGGQLPGNEHLASRHSHQYRWFPGGRYY